MRILVDSSIWIGYFNKGHYPNLEYYIYNDLVVVNDIILAELIPYISHVGKFDVVDALETIDKLKLNINWSEIISFQKMNLKNGVNKVGIPDLIILQQSIQNNYSLWSNDKHFQLMQKYVNLKLFVDVN